MNTPLTHAPRADTPERTPPLEQLLGYGPALLLAALALASWASIPLALPAAQIWGAAILLFLAGVTRGLSFFTEGGQRPSQLIAMLLRFVLGLAALLTPPVLGFPLLALGYLAIALYDPVAARTGAAPRFFAQLRPLQTAIMIAALLACFVAVVR